MRTSRLIGLLLALCGCPGAHLEDRARNATLAAAYSLELDKCIDQAVAVKQTTGDSEAAASTYASCADAADVKYGRTR